jgi:opacity protein-like surface antigen
MRTILPLFTILALTLTAAPRAARANGPTLELKSGTMFAGGTVGYTRTSDTSERDLFKTESTEVELVFSPTVGYFITPTLAITGSVMVGMKTKEWKSIYTEESSTATDSQKEKPLGAALGLRFLIPTGGRMCFYVGGEVAYARTEIEYKDGDWGGDTNTFNLEGYLMGVNVFGGLLYSLTNHVALDVGVKFTYQKGEMEQDGEPDTTEIENNGVSFGYLGLMAFF